MLFRSLADEVAGQFKFRLYDANTGGAQIGPTLVLNTRYGFARQRNFRDPYSLGTWCTYRPGQMTRFFPANRAQEGRLFFASSDTATGWRGFIDGAIERGLRVAVEADRFLERDI